MGTSITSLLLGAVGGFLLLRFIITNIRSRLAAQKIRELVRNKQIVCVNGLGGDILFYPPYNSCDVKTSFKLDGIEVTCRVNKSQLWEWIEIFSDPPPNYVQLYFPKCDEDRVYVRETGFGVKLQIYRFDISTLELDEVRLKELITALEEIKKQYREE